MNIELKIVNKKSNQFIDCFFYYLYLDGSLISSAKVHSFDWFSASLMGCHKSWLFNDNSGLKKSSDYALNKNSQLIKLSNKLKPLYNTKKSIIFISDFYCSNKFTENLSLDIFKRIISDFSSTAMAMFFPDFKGSASRNKIKEINLSSLGVIPIDDYMMFSYIDKSDFYQDDFMVEDFKEMVSR